MATITQATGVFRNPRGHSRPYFVGCAAPWDRSRLDLDGWQSLFRPGALVWDDATAAWINHEPHRQLGSVGGGELRLWTTPTGLFYKLTPPDTRWGRYIVKKLGEGKLTGVSIGHRIIRDDWSTAGGTITQLIERAYVEEVSLLVAPTLPGNPRTCCTLVGARPRLNDTQQRIDRLRGRLAYS